MIVELAPLIGATLVFLVATFGVAEAAERRIIPERFSEHPLVFALALGVYATSWTFYGSVGFARNNGLGFLAIYLGPTLACLAIPVLWRPLLHLARERQLASLADVLAFRFRSRTAGFLVTLVMLAGSLPYLALQVRAFAASVSYLSGGQSPAIIGLAFCVSMSIFAILFGARHATTSARHPGLLVAMALESLVKLVSLTAVAAFALFGVHGGWDGLGAWLVEHPEALHALYAPVADGPWASLLVLSFASAFLLPRQFHVAFTECPSDRALSRASWAFPLLLLLMNAGIPVILWAGERLEPTGNPDLWVLHVVAERPWLATLAFLGGLSAVSGMIVVTSLALSSMAMNYFVLPIWRPRDDFYARIVWARRALIAGSILGSWLVFLVLEKVGQLVELGLVSFVSVAQLLPGVIGVFFWRRASREGFVAGLVGGVAAWSIVLVWPMLARAGVLAAPLDVGAMLGLGSLDPWTLSTTTSLAVNGLLFAIVSVAFPQRPEEAEAAAACVSDAAGPSSAEAHSVEELSARLAQTIGTRAAQIELGRALAELSMEASERRPLMLRLLVEQVEKNLSGLFGPLLANLALGRDEGLDPGARRALAEQLHFIEARLESDEEKLRGLARDVDEVRRFLHRVLEDLPVGVCALGTEDEIVVWNGALAKITGQLPRPLIGTRICDLPEPWAGGARRGRVACVGRARRARRRGRRTQPDAEPRAHTPRHPGRRPRAARRRPDGAPRPREERRAPGSARVDRAARRGCGARDRQPADGDLDAVRAPRARGGHARGGRRVGEPHPPRGQAHPQHRQLPRDVQPRRDVGEEQRPPRRLRAPVEGARGRGEPRPPEPSLATRDHERAVSRRRRRSRRRAAARAGLRQPARERGRRVDAGDEGRGLRDAERRGAGARGRRRRGHGHPSDAAGPSLRALLHDEGSGSGHRPRVVARLFDHP
jgi:Na+/proline symporter